MTSHPTAADGPARLSRDRTFLRFWTAHAISIAGTSITLVVLPILIFQRTGSALQTSLLTTVEAAPYIVFGLVAGALADRAERRRLMVGCDLLNAVALGSIPVAAAAGGLTTVHIYVAAAIAATGFLGFDAGRFGALPAIVGKARLVPAMSALSSTDYVMLIAGPAVGGVLATTIGPAAAIGLDAVSYLASAGLLISMRTPFQTERDPEVTSGRGRTRADILEGLSFLWHHRMIRTLTLLGAVSALTNGAVIGLLVVDSVQELGLASGDARIGILFSAGAVGALVTTLLLPRLSRMVRLPLINLVSRTAGWALAVGFALARDYVLAVVLYVVWNGLSVLVITTGIAYRQLHTPDHLQGRVNVVARMIAWGGQPLGALFGGVLAELTNVRTALLTMSAAVGASAIAGWLGPLRSEATAGQVNAAEA